MAAEFNVKVITLPEGKDPDELIRKDVEAWKNSVKNSKHVMQYYFDKTFSAFNIKEAEGKRESARRILPVIGRMRDLIERDHWLKRLSEELNVSESALRDTLTAALNKEKRPFQKEEPAQSQEEPKRQSREDRLSEAFLSLIIRFPALIGYAMDKAMIDHVFGDENKVFYRSLIIYYNDVIGGQVADAGEKWLAYDSFRDWLMSESAGSEKLLEKLAIAADRDFPDFTLGKAKSEMILSLKSLKEAYYSSLSKEKERQVAEEERNGNEAAAIRLMEELNALKEERRINLNENE
jgi:DNA primase